MKPTNSSSTLALICTTMLSSHKVLALLQSRPFYAPLRGEEMREVVYLAYLPWAAREPDHVFDRSWQLLADQPANHRRGWWLPGALQALAGEFLALRHGQMHVKLEMFGAWQQSVLSRVSGLPIRAAGHVWPPNSTYFVGLTQSIWRRSRETQTWASAHLPILTPYDPLVEDYLRHEGLHETHLHLNGSTHAEQCWLRALLDPVAEVDDFDKTWGKSGSRESQKIRELALAINPTMSPAELRRQLLAARRLREWLVAAATGSLADNIPLPADYTVLLNDEVMPPEPAEYELTLSKASSMYAELRWQSALLKYLDDKPSVVLERMLHCYFLLQNQYYRLLVQNEEQYGFDQFQKLTYTGLRIPSERDYLNRFLAMHGEQVDYSLTGYMEGRFAPKGNVRENGSLLGNILGGYWHYLCRSDNSNDDTRSIELSSLLEQLERKVQAWASRDRRHLHLALVAHFIKQPWNSQSNKAGQYRFYSLRADLEKKTNALIQTLNAWPRLQSWIRGIDAAANELDAPPEVFASTYRVCRQAGLTRRSYHVGEDFPHLLSGLRNMLDALELLDLRDGDRIGHGTAMGIRPQLWLERMPSELVVTKGDWMLDLLASWRLLRRLGATAEAYKVECDLADLASELFLRDISCTALERAMRYRHLNLRYLGEAQSKNWSTRLLPLNELYRAEALLVEDALRNHKPDLDLLWEWQSDRDLWKRSEALKKVKADYLCTSYLGLQQELMREIALRNVLVETLPSSNVRISQYHCFREHHALRWMGVPGFKQEGDPAIMVTLGSDDPGIFAGNLHGEFYQLYAVLRGLEFSDKEALGYLAPLNERGREYRFHDAIMR